MKKPLLFCSLLALSAMLAVPVQAGNKELMALMKILKDNGTITEAQYQQLQAAAESSAAEEAKSAPATPAPTPAAEKKADEETVKVSSKGGLKVEVGDGKYEFGVNGRVFVDAASYSNDGDAGAFYDNEANDDDEGWSSGTQMRTARLGIEGTILKDWHFEAEWDFADNEVDTKDMWGGYFGFKPMEVPLGIKIGQFKVPFSLEEQSSSKYAMFMEDSLANAFSPGYRIGAGLTAHGDSWSAGAMLFGEEVGGDNIDDDDDADDIDEGSGVGARLTYAPINQEGRVLHLGLGGVHLTGDAVDNDDDYGGQNGDYARFRTRPEASINIDRLVDTGRLFALDHTDTYGVEAAGIWGPVTLQGEYMWTDVTRDRGYNDYDFSGWYAQAGWLITGESRVYEGDAGEIGKVKPKGKYGALEAAVRFSSIDLTDRDVVGGEEDNLTLGLNWYINNNVRFMADYVMVDTHYTDDREDEEPRILQARFQFHF